MKKLLSILLILICVSICGCNQLRVGLESEEFKQQAENDDSEENNSERNELDTDKVNSEHLPWKDSYMEFLLNETFQEENGMPTISFADLDFDGIPELLYYNGEMLVGMGQRTSDVYSINSSGDVYKKGTVFSGATSGSQAFYDKSTSKKIRLNFCATSQVIYLQEMICDGDSTAIVSISQAFATDDNMYHWYQNGNEAYKSKEYPTYKDVEKVLTEYEMIDDIVVEEEWENSYSQSKKSEIISAMLLNFESNGNDVSKENNSERNESDKSIVNDEQESQSFKDVSFSASIDEINGKTYSVREIPGLSILPIETSQYHVISSFCYYDGYVYYVESEGGSSDYSTWLYRCKPDWTGKELLDEIISDNYREGERSFIVDNGILYYNTYSPDVEATAINLSTMQKFKTKRPKYTVLDNRQTYDSSYSSGYSIAIYDDIKFFIDNNESLYIMNNEKKQLLATEVYSIDGLSEGYVYYSGISGSKAYLYRVSINGGEKEYIDSHMAAGGGVYFNW